MLGGLVIALVAFGLGLAAQALPGSLKPGCAQRVQERLFLGLNSPDGAIADAEWEKFVQTAVTPRFPAGLTVLEATGQWQGRDKTIGREPSRVIEIIHDGSREASRQVAEIASEYKTRYRQESVLISRARIEACF